LRASEERLRFAAQEAGFGSYELDLVTGQAYRSPEYKALFGLGPNDEFQLDADQVPVYVHPDDRALMREATRESRDPRGSGTKDVEYRVLLPDGTVRWLLVRGRVSFEGEGQARRAVRSRGIALDVTERKQLEQEILEISGREQRRIGHDLHDDLCQRLGGLQLLGGVLEKDLAAEGSSARAAQAGQLLARVQEALERARRLARGLAPVGLEEGGLATALQELAENAGQLFRIHCEFRAEAPVVAVADAGAATHLYRIAQEAISNAVRHGRASRVTLGLHRTGDGFELTVSDNGRGFSSTVATSGMGLRIMKYRAGMIGAALAVRSGIGQGTTVTCTFSAGLKAQRPKRQRAQAGRAKRKLTDASQAS
jgi:PAS domain S-box-containing protein